MKDTKNKVKVKSQKTEERNVILWSHRNLQRIRFPSGDWRCYALEWTEISAVIGNNQIQL